MATIRIGRGRSRPWGHFRKRPQIADGHRSAAPEGGAGL